MEEHQSYPGKSFPLGAEKGPEGYNLALVSGYAAEVIVAFFNLEKKLLFNIKLDPLINKTGDVWHITLEAPKDAVYYAYQIKGKRGGGAGPATFLVDPYAREVGTNHKWGEHLDEMHSYYPLGTLPLWEPFDWQGVKSPHLSREELLIYEMHIRGFTIHPSSSVRQPGTYLGVIEKIPHLVELGVNAVEILPLHEFDENEVLHYPNEALHSLHNYWGYSTVNFFSPMQRYATSFAPGAAINEFKIMVRELHRNGIQVILDVVFNHTGEGNEQGPSLSFKGIDPSIYYMYDTHRKMSNYTGCGNTFNCNHPIVRRFIIDCLRYWVLEMHVDGFRFDLASILQRGRDGHPMDYSPLIEDITEDPILVNTWLIAEPWDAAGLYQVGHFAPQSNRWSEWNAKYRDTVRKFIKGTPENNLKGDFITKICGSQDLYASRSPLSSLNFIVAHDGFTLRDLVSYNQKHNEANGEENRDGYNENESWNCGVEGETQEEEILELRDRQMRNFHLALMISSGIPMLVMGDEYAHTRKGNNNAWCQDNELNWFLWDEIKKNEAFFRFYKKMIRFRKTHPLLRRSKFLNPNEVDWHGMEPYKPEWDSAHRLVAFTLLNRETCEDLYIAFNTDEHEHKIVMPKPRHGNRWFWVADTANPPPDDFFDEDTAPPLADSTCILPPFSSCILEARCERQ